MDELARVIVASASFQGDDEGPAQLHPGDVGWHQKDGPEGVARSLRVWERNHEPVAIGTLDNEASIIRLAISPAVADDPRVAARITDDLDSGSILRAESASAEVRYGAALQRSLRERGWAEGDAWACFTLGLSRSLPDHRRRLAIIDGAETGIPDEMTVGDIVAAHRMSWDRSAFTTDKWHAMARGAAFRQGRSLVLYAEDKPVATATVWSAGPGLPGLIEPLGVARDQRGRGYGRAIVNACAAALRDLGASSMRVATPVTQWPAVPLYAATMRRLPDVHDLVRPTRVPHDP